MAKGEGMKRLHILMIFAVCLVATLALAEDMKDKVKYETDYVGLHPGVDPGMYVCGPGHVHIRGKVQNLSGGSLHRIKVEAKAYDAQGNLMGSAADATKADIILNNEKAEIDLEFRSIPGSKIKEVKKYDVVVTQAQSRE
jgi:hypothetical protein